MASLQNLPVFEQHAVPQNISSYQFRLIGDMTIKQFFQLAGGAVISLLFYASPLPNFFKWPFIIFFVLAGAAFAFLPFQERPLSEWVTAFFRSIYAPTIYRWTKPASPPVYFYQESSQPTLQPAPTQAGPAAPAHQTNLENAEKNFLTRFSSLFGQSNPPQAQAKPPSPQVSSPPPPAKPTPPVAQARPQVLTVPQAAAPKIKPQGFAQPTSQPTITPKASAVTQTLSPEKTQEQAIQAQFSPEAAPPIPPTQPNIVVGQVMDKNKSIIESAILEIKDPLGRPVRALKSNKAGHFLIVTPLNNGKYTIHTEKEGYTFTPVEVEATGSIIPPIAIQSS